MKQISRVLTISQGKLWFFPENEKPSLLVLKSGLVDVVAQVSDGMSAVLKAAQPGDLIPTLGFTDSAIAYALEAQTDSVLVPFQREIPEYIIQEICNLYKKTAEIALLSVDDRLRLFLERCEFPENGHFTIGRLSRILACRRETLSRALNRLFGPIRPWKEPNYQKSFVRKLSKSRG